MRTGALPARERQRNTVMNLHRRLLLCLALLVPAALTAGASGQAPAQIPWVTSLAQARAEAAAGKKLILAYLFADWCPYCRRMDRETWTDAAVIAERAKYVFLRLDGEKDPDGVNLCRRFFIRGFPAILLLHADGSEFDRLDGYMPADELLRRLKLVLEDPDSLGNLKAAAAGNPSDVALRLRLGRVLLGRMDLAGAQENFEEIVRLDPANRGKTTDQALLYLGMCRALQSDPAGALGTLERLERDFPKSTLVPRAWLLAGELLLQTGRREEGTKKIERFLEVYPDHPLAQRARQLLAKP